MRGLRGPCAGCALRKLLVALIWSGRASDSKKQGKLSGLGSELISVTVSLIVRGAFDTPAGARQPGVGLREAGALEAGALEAGALEAGALEAGALEAGVLEAGSLQPKVLSAKKDAHEQT